MYFKIREILLENEYNNFQEAYPELELQSFKDNDSYSEKFELINQEIVKIANKNNIDFSWIVTVAEIVFWQTILGSISMSLEFEKTEVYFPKIEYVEDSVKKALKEIDKRKES